LLQKPRMISIETLWWLPAVLVAAMSMLAILAAKAQAPGRRRSAWLAVILLCGAGAVAVAAWQQSVGHAALQEEAARLGELGTRLNELGQLLPAGPGSTPAETFDSVTAAITALNARIAELHAQIRTLQQKSQGRTIEPETAAKVAEYLRRVAPQRVVVSCVPDDVEAFAYANQIATMLREGGWEALGPEKTAIFGDAPSMAVKLFARNAAAPPDAARLLIDAFTRFNIPYQSGIAPNEAIPDAGTAELFVSHKS
jgi:hypothetical protein